MAQKSSNALKPPVKPAPSVAPTETYKETQSVQIWEDKISIAELLAKIPIDISKNEVFLEHRNYNDSEIFIIFDVEKPTRMYEKQLVAYSKQLEKYKLEMEHYEKEFVIYQNLKKEQDEKLAPIKLQIAALEKELKIANENLKKDKR